MDRFIGKPLKNPIRELISLKSNMDRFIEIGYSDEVIQYYSLKSNMDRFIDTYDNKTINELCV